MANLGLALYYGMPGVMDIQERARKLRMAEERAPLENQQLQQNIEMNNLKLMEEKKRIEQENRPIDITKFQNNPIVKTMITGAIDLGLHQEGEVITNKKYQDVLATFDKNPTIWKTKFAETGSDIDIKLQNITGEFNRVQGIIAQNQKIVNSPDASTEEKMKAMKEIEREQTYLKETNLQYGIDEFTQQKNQIDQVRVAIDTGYQMQQVINNNPEIIGRMSQTERDSLNLAVQLRDLKGVSNIIQESAKGQKETPTETLRLLNEYNAIKKANPKDPKLLQYEAELKRRGEGLPYFTFQPTAEGIQAGNVRTGKLGGTPLGGKPLTGEMITTEQQVETLKDTLSRVKILYKPNYVGFVEGKIGSLKEKTIGIESEQAAFYSNLEQVKNSLIYLMSGKQINESEYKRLLQQLPDRKLPDKVFKTRMEEFEKTLDSIILNRQKNMGGYGTQSPKAPSSTIKTADDYLKKFQKR